MAIATASGGFPSLATRSISPHTLRHTTAMHLLPSGVDITVIALWLGHEDPTTTHRYIEADLAMNRWENRFPCANQRAGPREPAVRYTPRRGE